MNMFDWIAARPLPEQKTEEKPEGLTVDEALAAQLEREFFAFDVETTGLSPRRDRIIEIGAVHFVGGKPVEEFCTLVNPHWKISEESRAVHGISQAEVNAAPCEETVYRDLLEFLTPVHSDRLVLAAHNAPFDLGFLDRALKRLHMERPLAYVDTLRESKKAFADLSDYRQNALCDLLQIENPHVHRAGADAKACGLILCEILQRRRQNGEQKDGGNPKKEDR